MLSEREHRAIGHTERANRYPLSPRALRMQAEMLNVLPAQVPQAARYAANYRMQAWYDLLGAEREAGRTYRRKDSKGYRYLTVTQILSGEMK